MKKIFLFTIILTALAACTAPWVETNSKFIRRKIAAKAEYAFFRMAAAVMSGLISGGSVARPLPRPLSQLPKEVVVVQQEVIQEEMGREVTWHPVPPKR
jgi:hypothetical protein